MKALRSIWDRHWFLPLAPRVLGICRFVFFTGLFVLERKSVGEAWPRMLPSLYEPIFLFKIFPWLHSLSSPWGAGLWCGSTLLAAAGYFTPLTVAVSAVITTASLGVKYGFGLIHFHEAAICVVAGVLACSRCGDDFSLDAWLVRRRRKKATLEERRCEGEYGWPVQLARLVSAAVLFSAGVSKLRHSGLAWVTSTSFANILVQNSIEHQGRFFFAEGPEWARWLAGQGPLAHAVAAMVVLTELAALPALFFPRVRRLFVPAAVCLFLGIFALMGLNFRNFLLLLPFWWPWERARR